MPKIRIYSPNHSCDPLRTLVLKTPIVLRLGSSKPHDTTGRIVLNSVEGIQISSDKRKSKRVMVDLGLHTAEYCVPQTKEECIDFVFDLVDDDNAVIIKKYNSCKGKGIYFIQSMGDLNNWLNDHEEELRQYVFERYYDFPREYRFHVDVRHGIFYGCRKLLKNDAEETWHRHDCNSVWILPENPKFKTPPFLGQIEEDCIRYMEEVGLDICAFDIKSDNTDFIILESNTAPSLGPHGIEMYRNHLLKYYNESI